MEAGTRTLGERGFTLIELLIVLAIVGILAGIAILAFNPYTEAARATCTRANDRIAAGADAAAEAAVVLSVVDVTDGTDLLRAGTDLACDGDPPA